MAWLRSPQTSPSYTGLQLQTSASTLPIPILWGQSKISVNVIWYANFQSVNTSGGKGWLGSSQNGASYTADVMLGLCEGPISNIGNIWKDQSVYSVAELLLSVYGGTTPQAVWPYLASNYPAQALAYQGTAWVGAGSYGLDSSGGVQNHNFEIAGVLAGTGINAVDGDPALVIQDFLTNPQYGCGFDPASIDASTLLGNSGDASLQSYCKATGIAFSPALVNQEQGSSILARWLQLLNCAAVWSGGELKFIPYGDTAVASGTQSTVAAQTQVPLDGQSIQVCSTAQWVSDGGVVYAYNGAPFAYIGASYPSSAGQYGISPAGVYLFAAADMGIAVVITFAYQTISGYTPNLTPVYGLADADFVDAGSNKDPVEASRVDPFSLATIQRIECLSRENEYSLTPVEARDQSQIDLFGPRVGSIIQAHEICDPDTIGPIVAQTILQRQLYVRAHFTFKLSWEYCLLDPMDIVEITDANLGLDAYPVRIVSIEEDDKGLLTIVAEELTVGVSTPAANPSAGQYGFRLNRGVAAQSVNAPLIYEPPISITGGAPQLWLGASGGLSGVADPNWGGANVFLSVDNVTYSEIATVTNKMRQGALSASLASASAGWDSTHTLSVSLAESAGVLTGTSQAAAQQGGTLSLVDAELICYETATLAGANAYNLTGLQRGMNGTTPASHASGAGFFRLDSAVVKVNLSANLIGQTLYVKFQSFNVFGGGVESLASCTAYTYVPTGGGTTHPIAAQLLTGVAVDLGFTGGAVSVGDDFSAILGAIEGAIDLGTAP